MKIRFEMSTPHVYALVNSVIDNIYNAGLFNSKESLNRFKQELYDSAKSFTDEDDFITNDFAGGTYRFGQNEASLYLDDEALVDIAVAVIKALSVTKPFFSTGMAMFSIFRGIKTSITNMFNEFSKNYKKKYGNAPTYAATEVHDEDLGLHAYITVRNDGYDHWSIFRRTTLEDFVNSECMSDEELDKICLQLFTKCLQRGDDIDFYEMSEETANNDHSDYVDDYLEDQDGDAKGIIGGTSIKDEDDPDCAKGADHYALVIIRPREVMYDSRIYTAIVTPDSLLEIKMMRDCRTSDAHRDKDVDEPSLTEYINARNRRGAYNYHYDNITDIHDTISILMTQGRWYAAVTVDDRVQIEEIDYTYIESEENK